MDRPLRAQGVAHTFRCLGPTCPATCCRGWTVPVEADQPARWAAMGIPKAQRPRLVAEAEFLRLAMTDDHACPELSTEGWCGFHQRWGEAALAFTCAQFPRRADVYPDRAEITLTASCPVVADAVAADDAASAFQPGTAELLPRPAGRRIDRAADDPTRQAAESIAAAAEAALRAEALPLRVRLLLVAALGTTATPEPTTPAARLERARAALARLRGVEVPLEKALRWMGAVLDAADHQHSLLRELRARCSHAGRPEHAIDLFRDRRAAADALGGAGPAPAWRRFAQHALRSQSPLHAPDPVAWVQLLLLQHAALRVLTLLHPDAEALLARPDPAAWATLVADVAWRVARDIEHDHARGASRSAWAMKPEFRGLGAMMLLAAP